MLRMRSSHGIRSGLAIVITLVALSCSEDGDKKPSSEDRPTAGKPSTSESSAVSQQRDSGESGTGAAGTAGAAGSSGSSVTSGASASGDAGAAPGTFSAIYENVFAKYCRLCHIGGGLQPDLGSRDAAYRSLVSVPANPKGQCSKLMLNRVEPGDPTKSLLLLKLSTKGAPCGQQMPPGGELKPELQSDIEQWISAGAHDD